MSGSAPATIRRRWRSPVPALAALAAGIVAASPALAQGRERMIDCSSLLFSGCRNYLIEVVRVEPDGTLHPQGDMDTYQEADPDTLDPVRFLVLELYQDDGLKGVRSVIWVDRQSGAVGGDWPFQLSNDQVRSAELRGLPGDAVELYDDRNQRLDRGMTRMVIFAGGSSCLTEVNLNLPSGGRCSSLEGQTVAGKVSGIVIRYRASSAAGPSAPERPAADVPAREAPAAE